MSILLKAWVNKPQLYLGFLSNRYLSVLCSVCFTTHWTVRDLNVDSLLRVSTLQTAGLEDFWFVLLRSFYRNGLLSTLQEGKYYLTYDIWPRFKSSYDLQKKMCAHFARVLECLLLFRTPFQGLCSPRAPASLMAEAVLWPLCWCCPHPWPHTLLEFTQVSLCSVVSADNSHPTVQKKC